jgi:hypothetical protein
VQPLGRTVEQVLAAIARGQHGLVTRAQMQAAQITRGEIRWRVQIGLLIEVYPGVYRVGHDAPCLEADYLAAVLACGDRALLCGRPAAFYVGLIKGAAPPPEVMTPGERRVEGLVTHRCRTIAPPWTRNGIPLTSVPRILVDLSPLLPIDDLARACHEAGVRYRTTPRHVRVVLERYGRLPGTAKLRDVILGDAPVVLSKLEKGFLTLLRAEGFPLPQTNKVASGRRVDCRWPAHHLTVELDSYRFHNSRYAWDQDRRREREAYARGDQHRRYTYGDVFEHPAEMLGELTRLLPRTA